KGLRMTDLLVLRAQKGPSAGLTIRQAAEFGAWAASLRLIDVLPGLQLSQQPIQITLLTVGGGCKRHPHFLGCLVKLALRAVHSSQPRMHEPLVRTFLRVCAIGREGLFAAFL